jgi:SNF2 family DNA or RNA helicase
MEFEKAKEINFAKGGWAQFKEEKGGWAQFKEDKAKEEDDQQMISLTQDFSGLSFELPLPSSVQASQEKKLLGSKHPIYQVALRHPYKLKKHQEECIDWAMDGLTSRPDFGDLLVAAMGLGKTLIALLLIVLQLRRMRLKMNNATSMPALVCAPLSLIAQWMNESEKYLPDQLRMLWFHKDKMGRKNYEQMTAQQLASDFDLVLVTYDTISLEGKKARPALLFQIKWSMIVFDESHIFSNAKTQLFQSICKLQAHRKLSLSGTPIRNEEEDMLSQLCALDWKQPSKMKGWSYDVFSRYQLQKHIKTMTWQDANLELPACHIQVLRVKLSNEEHIFLHALASNAEEKLKALDAGLHIHSSNILALITRVRQASTAAYSIYLSGKSKGQQEEEEEEEEETKKRQVLEKMEETSWIASIDGTAGIRSSKMQLLKDHILDIIRKRKQKALIFSNFVSVLNIAAYLLDTLGIRYVMMHGQIKEKQRSKAITDFEKDASIGCMLLHPKVGGQGLNLVMATHVFFLDHAWTHALDEQAIRRVWRLGQEKETYIYKLVAPNTIDDGLLELQQRKKLIQDTYLGQHQQEQTEEKEALVLLRDFVKRYG